MNNYEKMLSDARQRFATYDMQALASRFGVTDEGAFLRTQFLGEMVLAEKQTGCLTVGERTADFGEVLSVFDWLCDGAAEAAAAGEYCTVGSLPGVYVGGSGLTISGDGLARRIHNAPDAFCAACAAMGGIPAAQGDLSFYVPIFSGVSACLKFYFGDEEFLPQLTFLWDRNILQFVRYETVYYIAGCLQKRLCRLMDVYLAPEGSI